MPRCAFVFTLPLLLLCHPAPAADLIPATARAADQPHVFVITIGPGGEVWEKFGHNMLWIHDPQQRPGGPDAAYNWGLFDFSPMYPFKFLAGSLTYWMAAFEAPAVVQSYIDDDRTVIVQEIALPPDKIDALINAIEFNRLPENKYYKYDYYLDNCSTRVRDAIDGALAGTVRNQLEPKPTGTTYRWQTRRLTADDLAVDLALEFVLGPYADKPINQWQESFLPVKFMEHLRDVRLPGGSPVVISEQTLHTSGTYAERSSPPNRLVPYAIAGLVVGGIVALCGRAKNVRLRRGVGWTLAAIWCVIGGGGSIILLYTWFCTRHIPPKWNQNLWQLNPLLVALLIMIPLLRREKIARIAMWTSLAVVGLDVLGIAIKLLPIQHQSNADIVALSLLANAGLAVALYRRKGGISVSQLPSQPQP